MIRSLNKKKKKFDDLEQYIQTITKKEQVEIDSQLIDNIDIPEIRIRKRTSDRDLNREKNTCVVCNKEITGRKKTVEHYLNHADQIKKENKKMAEKALHNGLLQCSSCLEEFLTKPELQTHEDHYHIERRFMCPVCNKCIMNSQKYMEHIRTHEPKEENDSKSQNDSPITCQICGANFTRKKCLANHIKKHASLKTTKFQCKICLNQYTTKSFTRQHITQVHFGKQQERRVCDICGKSISKYKYLIHKKIHEDLRAFACTFCEKRFNARKYLTEHLRTHTGVKPYVCQYCGKAFTQKSPLNIHVRSHTGETPYICQLCNRGFVSKTLLDNHLKNDLH